ncbi:MAG: hypothetical protein IRY99_19800 [Isosphaeraceae bacterium]|nr:hypothetical protein [Isosphaeraceae bacterium]
MMRGTLEAGEDGRATLALCDLRGERLVTLEMAPGGHPGLMLYDKGDKRRLLLGEYADGGVGLGFGDREARLRLALALSRMARRGWGSTISGNTARST